MIARRILMLATVAATILASLTASPILADEEDETPNVEGFLETRQYVGASTRQVLNQFAYVIGEVDRFPAAPTPKEVDKIALRKQLLNLRLLMDFNAFAYKGGTFDRYRTLIDTAYEAIGLYKDLDEVYDTYKLPINPDDRDRRFNAMLNAVAPLRAADVRKKFEKAVDDYEKQLVDLGGSDRPRLWDIAQLSPTDHLDSAGNAARFGQAIMLNLRAGGLLVDDIFVPEQEVRFHDVRKALRSVLVLSDMFPSLTAAIGDNRIPLADLVKAYGKTNEQAIAYHAAQDLGLPLEERAAGLSKAYAKVQEQARQFTDSGQLDAYVAGLAAAEDSHHR